MISNQQGKFVKIKPWIGSILILPVITFVISNEGRIFIVDYINLLIHEGGHGIFSLFGKFIHALGGTLMQIIIPTMFIIYYLNNKKKFLSQIFLVWLGQNLINISIYAADARARKLPLLGGSKVYHDWTYMLSQLGLLEYDQAVGNIFFSLSIATFIIALIIPLILREQTKVNIDLSL